MSSRTRGKENARARAAELRAAQARADRRRRVALAGGAIVIVVVIVAVLVVVRLTKDDSTTTASPKAGTTTLSASVLEKITTVPAATFDKVGATGVAALPSAIKAPALTADGKPELLYVGAEYCPYCAAQRWPVVVALSRFGTWSGLEATASAAGDVFPNTPTLSFHGATFSSDVLSFHGYETQSNKQVNGQYAPLDSVPASDQKVFDTYNKPPYVASGGGIPFLDVAGRYVQSGATYGPDVLAGKTRAQIAAAINDPNSDIGKAVLANANVLSAAICQATGGKPAEVCTSAGVKAAEAALEQAK